MTCEQMGFFSWGHPKNQIAKGIDAPSIPPDSYNRTYLKGIQGQKTPIPSTKAPVLPPKNSRLWDSNLFGIIPAIAIVEPDPNIFKANENYLKPNPKTVKHTPIPVPYVKETIMKEFLAGDKADKPTEAKESVDYFEIAKSQRKDASPESDEFRFWDDIVQQLTKFKVLKATRELTQAEKDIEFSIIEQIKAGLAEVSQVAPIAPTLPPDTPMPPEPEEVPAEPFPIDEASAVGDVMLKKRMYEDAEIKAIEARKNADVQYKWATRRADEYNKKPSRRNKKRLDIQLKLAKESEQEALNLERDELEKKKEFKDSRREIRKNKPDIKAVNEPNYIPHIISFKPSEKEIKTELKKATLALRDASLK